jgi:hypothetical protein
MISGMLPEPLKFKKKTKNKYYEQRHRRLASQESEVVAHCKRQAFLCRDVTLSSTFRGIHRMPRDRTISRVTPILKCNCPRRILFGGTANRTVNNLSHGVVVSVELSISRPTPISRPSRISSMALVTRGGDLERPTASPLLKASIIRSCC